MSSLASPSDFKRSASSSGCICSRILRAVCAAAGSPDLRAMDSPSFAVFSGGAVRTVSKSSSGPLKRAFASAAACFCAMIVTRAASCSRLSPVGVPSMTLRNLSFGSSSSVAAHCMRSSSMRTSGAEASFCARSGLENRRPNARFSGAWANTRPRPSSSAYSVESLSAGKGAHTDVRSIACRMRAGTFVPGTAKSALPVVRSTYSMSLFCSSRAAFAVSRRASMVRFACGPTIFSLRLTARDK